MRPAAPVFVGLALACASGISTPDPPPASAAGQVARGARLYAARCARCHGATDSLGPALDGAVIRSYGTARALGDYISMAMPFDAPGTLSDSATWAITAHLVVNAGVPLSYFLTVATADQVRLLR